jgi:ketosteroid isomerase-like protein
MFIYIGRVFCIALLSFVAFAANANVLDNSDCVQQRAIEAQNIKLVKSMLDNMNDVWKSAAGDSVLFDSIYAKDFAFYGNGVIEKRDRFKKHLIGNLDKWNPLKLTIYDIFASGDKVVVRAHVKSTAKTGTIYDADFIDIYQIENGKMTKWWEQEYPDWRAKIESVGEKY